MAALLTLLRHDGEEDVAMVDRDGLSQHLQLGVG
eukprot:CAMPEP_0168608680 /NCGR_PEP_ID=MMETSP0449_2-20121227/771_1 /TAXON_ID=1082188 /ORGANISM="Strombidium rassoulzadegani, Strain ras09" /LENGTH=33 /DNA_ID= /DNA_START= /DNA_END= /DNA_ORIENTATION=